MQIFIRGVYWVALNIVAMWLAVMIVPGVRAPHALDIVWAGVVLSLVNMWIAPILRIITCPLRLLTFGLFSLVVNMVIFLFAAWLSRKLGASIVVASLWAAFFAAVVISIVTTVGERAAPGRRKKRN